MLTAIGIMLMGITARVEEAAAGEALVEVAVDAAACGKALETRLLSELLEAHMVTGVTQAMA